MSLPIRVKLPTHAEMAHIRDPASSGRIKMTTQFRIAGGARNIGFKRPPVPSEAVRMNKVAVGFFNATRY